MLRNRLTFLTGFAIGFLAGARAGRERYEQIMEKTRQAAGSPQAKQLQQTVTVKTTEFSKIAADRIPKMMKKAKSTAGDRFDHFPGAGRHAQAPDTVSVDGARASGTDSPGRSPYQSDY